MRLNTEQIQAIRLAANTAFGDGTPGWLFGSRVDVAQHRHPAAMKHTSEQLARQHTMAGCQGRTDALHDSHAERFERKIWL